MEKTTFEFVQMDRDLPMKVLHFSKSNLELYSQMKALALNDTSINFVPMHWHKELEITFVVKGHLRLRKNQKVNDYLDGTFFVVNSGEIHELTGQLEQDVNIICFLISYDFIKNYLPNIDNLYFEINQTKENAEALESVFYSIFSSYQSEEKYAYLGVQSGLLSLLQQLCQNHLSKKEDTLKLSESNQLNQEILDFIHQNYDQKLSLADISSQFNFSREHFSRIFKENFGCTFLTYLTDYRLYRAFPEIINGNHTIELISQKHGFPSSKALIKYFKQVYQDSPIQYRKKHNIQIVDHNDTSI